jgi:hypothetical protein
MRRPCPLWAVAPNKKISYERFQDLDERYFCWPLAESTSVRPVGNFMSCYGEQRSVSNRSFFFGDKKDYCEFVACTEG